MNAFTPIPTTFIPLTPHLRRRIEETIEQLMAILDAFDGDPDLEPDAGDMPDQDAGDEREPEEDFEIDPGDDCEMDEDFEPALGWTDWPDQSQPCWHGESWRWSEDENERSKKLA